MTSLVQAISDPLDGLEFVYETCTYYGRTRQAYRSTLWNMLAFNASPDESACVLMTPVRRQAKVEQSSATQ